MVTADFKAFAEPHEIRNVFTVISLFLIAGRPIKRQVSVAVFYKRINLSAVSRILKTFRTLFRLPTQNTSLAQF